MPKHYRVYVPGSSKWKKCSRKIVLEIDGESRESEITLQTLAFEFEVPDKYEWIHSNKVVDNCSFNISVEFSNKSKKEVKYLVPERVDHANNI